MGGGVVSCAYCYVGALEYWSSGVDVRIDGRIWLVGEVSGSGQVHPQGHGFVIQLNANGAPDAGFGVGGAVFVDARAYQSTQLADFTAWDKLRFVGHQAVLAGTASSDPVAVGMWNNDVVLTRVGSDGDADLIFADDFGDRALN